MWWTVQSATTPNPNLYKTFFNEPAKPLIYAVLLQNVPFMFRSYFGFLLYRFLMSLIISAEYLITFSYGKKLFHTYITFCHKQVTFNFLKSGGKMVVGFCGGKRLSQILNFIFILSYSGHTLWVQHDSSCKSRVLRENLHSKRYPIVIG